MGADGSEFLIHIVPVCIDDENNIME
jgi:hypothetical protein